MAHCNQGLSITSHHSISAPTLVAASRARYFYCLYIEFAVIDSMIVNSILEGGIRMVQNP